MAALCMNDYKWKRGNHFRIQQVIILSYLCTVVLSTSVPPSCQEPERHDTQGEISSPNYPLNYPNNTPCKWHIYHEKDEVVTISFKAFDIEETDGSACSSDSLEIQDKESRVYCGSEIPAPYISTLSGTDRLIINFQSDGSITGSGFWLEYFKGKAEAESCDAETQFHCANKKCIPKTWLCNNMDECGDRSDEAVDVCRPEPTQSSFTGSTTASQCPHHTMYCLEAPDTPQCLPEDKKCDGSEDCLNGEDEAGCETICKHQLEDAAGYFSSPNYPDDYSNNLNCHWTIVVPEGNIVQLRFITFNLEQGYLTDYVTVYDGSSEYSADIIGTYYGYKSNSPATSTHYPPAVIEGTGNRLLVVFHTDRSSSNSGFNATYQTKGHCIDDQRLCSADDLNCYSSIQHCDGELTCLRGEDEMGCSGCSENLIPCDPESTPIRCYAAEDRCNGQPRCNGKEDETNCPKVLCNSAKGSFLCHTGQCIQENWMCDSNVDCTDGSDEMTCPMSTKVITAAVVGSVVCGLLLVAALSCTCKLYQLYHSDPHPPTHTSPLREIEDELLRREAPPSYTATMSSPHFDEAQRAFIESLQAAAQARQETNGGLTRRNAQRGPRRSQQGERAQSGESGAAAPSAEQTTQDTLSTSDTDSPEHCADTMQQTGAASNASGDVTDENSYTEIAEIRQTTQVADTSSCTTDTDSDTNAEAEIEQINRDIIRAAANIRRIRLAGGIQSLVDRVTEQQREEANQGNGDGNPRRRSSSGLQSVMERINRSREQQSREASTEEGVEPERSGSPPNDQSGEEQALSMEGGDGNEAEQRSNREHESVPASLMQHPSLDRVPDPSRSDNPEDECTVTEDIKSNDDSPLQDWGGTSPPHASSSTSDDDDDAPLNLSDSQSLPEADSTLIEDDDVPLVL